MTTHPWVSSLEIWNSGWTLLISVGWMDWKFPPELYAHGGETKFSSSFSTSQNMEATHITPSWWINVTRGMPCSLQMWQERIYWHLLQFRRTSLNQRRQAPNVILDDFVYMKGAKSANTKNTKFPSGREKEKQGEVDGCMRSLGSRQFGSSGTRLWWLLDNTTKLTGDRAWAQPFIPLTTSVARALTGAKAFPSL